MREVILTEGLPCSGKSTWAKEQVKENPDKWSRVNRDELRLMMSNYTFNKINERIVKGLRDAAIVLALDEGRSVIIDETGLDQRVKDAMEVLVEDWALRNGEKVTFRIKKFDVELDVALARNKERNSIRLEEHQVPDQVIKDMHRKYLKPFKDVAVTDYRVQDNILPSAVICDLDGTLAIMNGRSPFDASTCEQDLVNEPVRNVIEAMQDRGHEIIFLSGRSDEYKDQTIKFLHKAGLEGWYLFMRKDGDYRKDSIVKRELFENHIENRYYVEFVLDDRNQVVDLWRKDLKLPCFQVNYGDF